MLKYIFIEVVAGDDKRQLINVNHITSVVECDEKTCFILLDETNCCKAKASYEEVIAAIMGAINNDRSQMDQNQHKHL